jgi:predicted dehydrogenase
MVEAQPIRWGILATGGIAATFAEDLARLDDATVVAVGSRSIEAARAFARTHRIGKAHGSWGELAADPDLDVVYVATPHAAHHPAATACLTAGKAVLCEKPLTLDLATAQDLVGTAARHGVFLMEAMWMRTNPVIRRVAAMVADGAIGTVTAVLADFGVAGPFDATHRMRAPELGGGALLDLGVYPVALAHLILGPPAQVTARASLTPEGVDENTGIVLGYPSGAVATLHCGIVGETGRRATIVGTRGRVELSPRFWCPSRAELIRGDQVEEIAEPVRGHGMVYEAEEVHRCLRAGLTQSALVPLESTLAVMRTLDEARAQIGVSYPS